MAEKPQYFRSCRVLGATAVLRNTVLQRRNNSGSFVQLDKRFRNGIAFGGKSDRLDYQIIT